MLTLGLGNNVDYEITWDTNVIEDLVATYNITQKDLIAPQSIDTERDLLLSILWFMQNSSGGEKFVSSAPLIDDFSGYFQKNITLGGTSVRAALAMEKLGIKAGLHLVTTNDYVRNLLPEHCTYISSSDGDSIYPHLIVQYPSGAVVTLKDNERIVTTSCNRIIYVNDVDNEKMKLSDKLAEMLSQSEIFLISGFNAMRDRELLVERLDFLGASMESLKEGALVFHEDACYHDHSFPELVREKLAGKIDIFSMNEDELQTYLNEKLDLLNPQDIANALKKIYALINVPVLVVHTKYWALAYGRNAEKYKDAVSGGVIMAGTRYKHGDNFSVANYEDSKNDNVKAESQIFTDQIKTLLNEDVCCIPSIDADETNATTIGLGDSFVGGFLAALSRSA